jgi:hypothetical protein
VEKKKRNVSIRLSESDIRKIKDISERLGVKESELFRFSIKNMLAKLITLSDSSMNGADLIPTWLECGRDLLVHFDIDVERLDDIFNLNASEGNAKVDEEDLDLMILSYFNENYAVKKLSELCGVSVTAADVTVTLRRYLYEKYVVLKERQLAQPVSYNNLAGVEYAVAY